MDIQERILDLNRVKVQLLISWLSNQELVALINACDQEVEDYILDNISASGRAMLLQDLGFSEKEFQERKTVRVALNKIYNELLGKNGVPLKGSERKALQEKSYAKLNDEQKEKYQSRFHKKISDLGSGFERQVIDYVEKLEKGHSL